MYNEDPLIYAFIGKLANHCGHIFLAPERNRDAPENTFLPCLSREKSDPRESTYVCINSS